MVGPKYAVDFFSPFCGRLVFQGWVADEGVASLELRLEGDVYPLQSFGQASPDVAAIIPGAEFVRYSENIDIRSKDGVVHRARLAVIYENGNVFEISDLGAASDPARDLVRQFPSLLQKTAQGAFLEVGSRARSGLVNRALVPDDWTYVGLDVLPGENVDVVGDAHELSSIFPTRRFDAVMAFSVLEHIAMPWKFAVELNQVLNVGAVGLFTTHQAWPIHDAPWDFWRFSDESWKSLFNKETGFEVVDAKMGEPGFIVAQRCHAATNFGLQNSYLASNVIVRKISETALRWPVKLADINDSSYPKDEQKFSK